jgi:DNA-binding transcriptional MocR family regulator
VLFTPGRHFSPSPDASRSTIRLNFSHADEASAEQGLAILGDLIRAERLAA